MRRLGMLLLVVAAAACSRLEEKEARGAVVQYLDKLQLAYRASDEMIVDPLVMEPHGRKLTGVIGVKTDLGVVLDSKLLEIEFEGISGDRDATIVETRERWHY